MRQFLRDDICAVVLAVIAHTGIDARDIEIELTESTLIEDFDNALRSLNVLHTAGVRIAIDDFGTGYSSLQRLLRLPIDYLKIDRSFVEDIGRSRQHEIIVKSTIDLAHNLGVEVIAEGVETQQQAAYLQATRCDFMQGYLFSRPLPQASFERLLPRRRRVGIGG